MNPNQRPPGLPDPNPTNPAPGPQYSSHYPPPHPGQYDQYGAQHNMGYYSHYGGGYQPQYPPPQQPYHNYPPSFPPHHNPYGPPPHPGSYPPSYYQPPPPQAGGYPSYPPQPHGYGQPPPGAGRYPPPGPNQGGDLTNPPQAPHSVHSSSAPTPALCPVQTGLTPIDPNRITMSAQPTLLQPTTTTTTTTPLVSTSVLPKPLAGTPASATPSAKAMSLPAISNLARPSSGAPLNPSSLVAVQSQLARPNLGLSGLGTTAGALSKLSTGLPLQPKTLTSGLGATTATSIGLAQPTKRPLGQNGLASIAPLGTLPLATAASSSTTMPPPSTKPPPHSLATTSSAITQPIRPPGSNLGLGLIRTHSGIPTSSVGHLTKSGLDGAHPLSPGKEDSVKKQRLNSSAGPILPHTQGTAAPLPGNQPTHQPPSATAASAAAGYPYYPATSQSPYAVYPPPTQPQASMYGQPLYSATFPPYGAHPYSGYPPQSYPYPPPQSQQPQQQQPPQPLPSSTGSATTTITNNSSAGTKAETKATPVAKFRSRSDQDYPVVGLGSFTQTNIPNVDYDNPNQPFYIHSRYYTAAPVADLLYYGFDLGQNDPHLIGITDLDLSNLGKSNCFGVNNAPESVLHPFPPPPYDPYYPFESTPFFIAKLNELPPAAAPPPYFVREYAALPKPLLFRYFSQPTSPLVQTYQPLSFLTLTPYSSFRSGLMPPRQGALVGPVAQRGAIQTIHTPPFYLDYLSTIKYMGQYDHISPQSSQAQRDQIHQLMWTWPFEDYAEVPSEYLTAPLIVSNPLFEMYKSLCCSLPAIPPPFTQTISEVAALMDPQFTDEEHFPLDSPPENNRMVTLHREVQTETGPASIPQNIVLRRELHNLYRRQISAWRYHHAIVSPYYPTLFSFFYGSSLERYGVRPELVYGFASEFIQQCQARFNVVQTNGLTKIPVLPYYNSHALNNYCNGRPEQPVETITYRFISSHSFPWERDVGSVLLKVNQIPTTMGSKSTRVTASPLLTTLWDKPYTPDDGNTTPLIYQYVEALHRRSLLLSVKIAPLVPTMSPIAEQTRDFVLFFRERQELALQGLPIAITTNILGLDPAVRTKHFYQQYVSENFPLPAETSSSTLTAPSPTHQQNNQSLRDSEELYKPQIPTVVGSVVEYVDAAETLINGVFDAFQSQRNFSRDLASKWTVGRVVFKINGEVFEPQCRQPRSSKIPFAVDLVEGDQSMGLFRHGDTDVDYYSREFQYYSESDEEHHYPDPASMPPYGVSDAHGLDDEDDDNDDSSALTARHARRLAYKRAQVAKVIEEKHQSDLIDPYWEYYFDNSDSDISEDENYDHFDQSPWIIVDPTPIPAPQRMPTKLGNAKLIFPSANEHTHSTSSLKANTPLPQDFTYKHQSGTVLLPPRSRRELPGATDQTARSIDYRSINETKAIKKRYTKQSRVHQRRPESLVRGGIVIPRFLPNHILNNSEFYHNTPKKVLINAYGCIVGDSIPERKARFDDIGPASMSVDDLVSLVREIATETNHYPSLKEKELSQGLLRPNPYRLPQCDYEPVAAYFSTNSDVQFWMKSRHLLFKGMRNYRFQVYHDRSGAIRQFEPSNHSAMTRTKSNLGAETFSLHPFQEGAIIHKLPKEKAKIAKMFSPQAHVPFANKKGHDVKVLYEQDTSPFDQGTFDIPYFLASAVTEMNLIYPTRESILEAELLQLFNNPIDNCNNLEEVIFGPNPPGLRSRHNRQSVPFGQPSTPYQNYLSIANPTTPTSTLRYFMNANPGLSDFDENAQLSVTDPLLYHRTLSPLDRVSDIGYFQRQAVDLLRTIHGENIYIPISEVVRDWIHTHAKYINQSAISKPRHIAQDEHNITIFHSSVYQGGISDSSYVSRLPTDPDFPVDEQGRAGSIDIRNAATQRFENKRTAAYKKLMANYESSLAEQSVMLGLQDGPQKQADQSPLQSATALPNGKLPGHVDRTLHQFAITPLFFTLPSHSEAILEPLHRQFKLVKAYYQQQIVATQAVMITNATSDSVSPQPGPQSQTPANSAIAVPPGLAPAVRFIQPIRSAEQRNARKQFNAFYDAFKEEVEAFADLDDPASLNTQRKRPLTGDRKFNHYPIFPALPQTFQDPEYCGLFTRSSDITPSEDIPPLMQFATVGVATSTHIQAQFPALMNTYLRYISFHSSALWLSTRLETALYDRYKTLVDSCSDFNFVKSHTDQTIKFDDDDEMSWVQERLTALINRHQFAKSHFTLASNSLRRARQIARAFKQSNSQKHTEDELFIPPMAFSDKAVIAIGNGRIPLYLALQTLFQGQYPNPSPIPKQPLIAHTEPLDSQWVRLTQHGIELQDNLDKSFDRAWNYLNVAMTKNILYCEELFHKSAMFTSSDAWLEFPDVPGSHLGAAKASQLLDIGKYRYLSCYFKRFHLVISRSELNQLMFELYFSPVDQNLQYATDPCDYGIWCFALRSVLQHFPIPTITSILAADPKIMQSVPPQLAKIIDDAPQYCQNATGEFKPYYGSIDDASLWTTSKLQRWLIPSMDTRLPAVPTDFFHQQSQRPPAAPLASQYYPPYDPTAPPQPGGYGYYPGYPPQSRHDVYEDQMVQLPATGQNVGDSISPNSALAEQATDDTVLKPGNPT